MKRIRRIANYLLLPTAFAATLVSNSAHPQGAGQKTFSSSAEALTAFIQAARDGNPSELGAILGPGSEQIVESGDSVADKAGRESFLKWYDERHSLVPSSKGEFTLQVGKDSWPLPIPLAHSGGKWYWDGAAGKEEILYRRIGHNELAAIEVCKGIVAAQHDYASSAHDGQPAGSYAGRIVSEPGRQNGLYWEVKQGRPKARPDRCSPRLPKKAMTPLALAHPITGTTIACFRAPADLASSPFLRTIAPAMS